MPQPQPALPRPTADQAAAFAPTGRLRAAINYGNPVLAQRGPGGEPSGVSVALAKELARRLMVPLHIVPFDAAGKVVDALADDVWDIAFLAIDPLRAEQITYSAPYVVIEGTYLVKTDSALQQIDDFDRAGVRIAVGLGAAYDLYLSRTLKSATLVRSATSESAVDDFLRARLEAVAGVRQPLEQVAARDASLRVIPGCFTKIQQAMGMPRHRSAGAAALHAFVEEMKACGFVADALRASGQGDALVAPPAPQA
jgi:polar amino acid transport system substrate-binding protein